MYLQDLRTCLFDLEYGLPVQVRDKFMEELAALSRMKAVSVAQSFLEGQPD